MIKLSDRFNYRRLIKFTVPSISMSIFTSIYGVVDGFFISNFVGKIEFAALNFILPFLTILSVTGFLFGTGGAALIAKTLGEGDRVKANKIFSMLVYISIGVGIFLSVLGFFFIEDFAKFLGAEEELLRQSVLYGKIFFLALPAVNLQFEFSSLFVAAEKPNFGFQITVLAGLTNIFFDVLLIIVFDLGFKGAAAATALSYYVGGFLPVIYFSRKNSSLLRLTKFEFDGKALLKTCTNGLSERDGFFSFVCRRALQRATFELLRRKRGRRLRNCHVRQLDFSINFNRLHDRSFAGDKLQSRREKLSGVEKFAKKKFGDNFRVVRHHVCRRGNFCGNFYENFCRLRFRFDGDDGSRFSSVFVLVPAVRVHDFFRRIFHGVEQRICFGYDFIFAHVCF